MAGLDRTRPDAATRWARQACRTPDAGRAGTPDAANDPDGRPPCFSDPAVGTRLAHAMQSLLSGDRVLPGSLPTSRSFLATGARGHCFFDLASTSSRSIADARCTASKIFV